MCFAVSISRAAILPALVVSVHIGNALNTSLATCRMMSLARKKVTGTVEGSLRVLRRPCVWCTPGIPALGRLRQEDYCKFKARLSYITNIWTARTKRKNTSQTRTTKSGSEQRGSQEVPLTPSWTGTGNWWLWKREHLFPLGMHPPRGYPCTRRWLHTCAHTGRTKWTQWVSHKQRAQGLEREKWWGRGSGEGREWGVDLRRTLYACMEFSNDKKKIT